MRDVSGGLLKLRISMAWFEGNVENCYLSFRELLTQGVDFWHLVNM